MRKLLIAVGGIVVAVAAVPFIMGFVVEHDLKGLVEHANKSNDVTVALKDYHRGWFKSTAVIEVHIKKMNAHVGEGDLLVQANETIRHGPIFRNGNRLELGRALIESKIILPTDVDAALNMLFGGGDNQPQLIHSTKITLMRDIESHVAIPKFTLKRPGQGELNWLGFDSNLMMSANYQKTTGQLKLDGVTVDSPMAQAKVGPIQMQFEALIQDDANRKAHFTYDQPSLSATFLGQPIVAMEALHLDTKTLVKNNVLSQKSDIVIGKSNITTYDFGPGIFESEIKNLNVGPLRQFATSMQTIQDNKALTEAEREEQLNKSLAQNLPLILADHPEFVIDKFEMNLPNGLMQATAQVTLNPMAPDQQAMAYFRMPENWQVRLSAKIPQAVFQQIVMMYMSDALKQERDTQMMVAKQQNQQAIAPPPAPTTTPTTTPTTDPAYNTPAAPAPAAAGATPATPVMSDEELQQKASAATTEQLTLWENSGYLKKTDAGYEIDLQLDKGKLTLNGKEVAYR